MKRFFTRHVVGSFLKDALSVFGILGVVIAITEFFSQLSAVNGFLKESPYVVPGVAAVAVIWAGLKNWPKTCFEYKINNKDIRIRFVIGDVLEQPGAVVVPINNEFDAFLGGSVEQSKSIKAQVIGRFFDGDCELLQSKIKKELRAEFYKGSRLGSQYRIGTTIGIEQNKRRFYLAANSVKTNPKRVEARDEDVAPTLAGLWAYLTDHAAKCDVVVPMMGTGNGRLSMRREDVFKEIVRSFIASCSTKSYSDRLTIVVSPDDVQNCEIDVDMLDEFLRLNCKYATFSSGSATPTGTAVPKQ